VHTLRHSVAVGRLESGVHVKAVANCGNGFGGLSRRLALRFCRVQSGPFFVAPRGMRNSTGLSPGFDYDAADR